MALFSKKQFEELAHIRSKYCISVYVPTHRSGDNKESTITLKNLLVKIRSQLTNMGVKNNEINKVLGPAYRLLEDTFFWRHLSDSLAIFITGEMFIYHTLPLRTEEFAMVSDRFYLLPLLSIFNNDDRFFILVLSLKKNSLYEATQNEISQIVISDMVPESIEASAGRDVEQKSLQFRTQQAGGNYGQGMFHGKGEGKDDKKAEIIKYLNDIDKGLAKILEDYSIPLIVASVNYIFSIFHSVSSYKNIFPENISGNYDKGDLMLIHEKACEILRPCFAKKRNLNKEKFVELTGKTTSKIDEVVKAADAGVIESLFVRKNIRLWGDYDKEVGKIEVHRNKKPLDNCLLDFVAKSTFLKGGNVFLEEQGNLPEKNSLASALLRY